VQVVEAAAEYAYYPVAQTYRRTLARVATGGADFYVVDLFRVKGGQTHDWICTAIMEENGRIETPLAMQSSARTLHGNIEGRTDGQVIRSARIQFRFARRRKGPHASGRGGGTLRC
jgi:hypothetical protein